MRYLGRIGGTALLALTLFGFACPKYEYRCGIRKTMYHRGEISYMDETTGNEFVDSPRNGRSLDRVYSDFGNTIEVFGGMETGEAQALMTDARERYARGEREGTPQLVHDFDEAISTFESCEATP